MFIYKSKNNTKNEHFIQHKDVNVNNIRMPIINDVRIQQKKSHTNQTEIVQKKLYYRDDEEDKTVNNLEEFNRYLLLCGYRKSWILKYSNFNVDAAKVDAVIALLEERDLIEVNSLKKAIGLIQTKIQKNDVAIRAAEQERINALAERLKNSWEKQSDRGGGTFIGNPARWHIHTDIGTQEHLKSGNSEGSRKSTNNADAIIVAVEFLINCNGLNEKSGQNCYKWLRYTLITRYNRDLPEELRRDM